MSVKYIDCFQEVIDNPSPCRVKVPYGARCEILVVLGDVRMEKGEGFKFLVTVLY